MRWHRIAGMLLQEYYLTLHSLEIFVDVFFYPLMSLIVFGFISLYIAGSNLTIARNVLVGMFFWQVTSISQYCVSMPALWNLWSRNLSNLFISPLNINEFLTASATSAFIKSILIFTISSIISFQVFHLNIFSIGFSNIILLYLSIFLFAFSVGIFILGFLFRFGPKYQALAWGLIQFVQPLSATFYTVTVLPSFLQPVAHILPSTYAFEAARYGLKTHAVNWQLILTSLALDAVYLILTWIFFNRMYLNSRKSGQFVRNEG